MNQFERLDQTIPIQTTRHREPTQVKSDAEKSDGVAGPVRGPGDLERAVEDFDRDAPAPVLDDEKIVEMLMKNAVLLDEAGERRLASNILRNVLIRRPDHPEALMRMGLCLRDEGRHEEALKCFRALAKTERKLEAQILIAETFYLNENDAMALAGYRDVLKQVVGDQKALFEIYKNVGNIHVRAGDFDAAEEFYNKAYTIQPESDVLMVNYGTLEIQREALPEAVQRFRRSVEINKDNDKGWVGLSLVHRQMGDHDLAWANVQRALDINKRNRTALRLVVDWGVADHRVSAAVSHLQEYLDIDGEDAEMSFTLAKLFTHAGRLTEARMELERVLALDPGMQGADALRAALDKELAPRAATPPQDERSH